MSVDDPKTGYEYYYKTSTKDMYMKKSIYFLFIIIKYLFIPLSAQTPVISHAAFQAGKKNDDVRYSMTDKIESIQILPLR